MKMLLTADWLAPMTSPLMREGAVIIEGGVVIDAGPEQFLRQRHPDAIIEALGEALVLPGLINAHTHLELSDLVPLPYPGSFVQWLEAMIARNASATPKRISQATQIGIEQCLRFGVTTVADISRNYAITRPLLGQSPLNAVSFAEITAMGKQRGELEERLHAAISVKGNVRIGLEPHAPYSIEIDGYRRCVETALAMGMPLTTHLAESKDETEFLADLGGPFRRLWDKLPWFDEAIPRFEGGPIRLAKATGLLDYPTLLAHVNYCDDQELDLLAAGKASIIYCPRTHRYFGHPPHRWREMIQRGILVALATDSCASSPNLNLMDDLRLLHEIAPEMRPQKLFELVTINAARAIGDMGIGSIEADERADLVVFRTTSSDPLREVLESSALPERVYCAGQLA